MDLLLLHLVVLALWGGVLASEGVLEILPLRSPELRRAAIAFHYYIDLIVELPLLIAIVATGWLLLRDRPFDGLVAIKVVSAGASVLANLFCVGFVVNRRLASPEEQSRWTRRIFGSALVSIPGGIVALYLGVHLAG